VDIEQIYVDRSTQTEIVQSLAEKLKAHYVFPDIAGQICTCLQEHLDGGDYADITEGEFLALALTLHMQEVNHDEHLWVRWHPQPLPDYEGPVRHNQEWQEERNLEARLDNYGLHKVERLPGNVGYIDIRYFHRPAWGGDTAVAAMNFLANANALIIDLRKCTGGYPGMIALIGSYLLGEEPVHLNSIYWRDEEFTQQYWTLPHVPGARFSGNAVYVLVSEATFSGGEGFANILQAHRRAILVGEKTDGGAHPGASYRLNSHFEVFIPIGCAIDPVNRTDWEGKGVTPDIAVPQEQAFKVAYKIALKSILAGLGESPCGPLSALAEEAQLALNGIETA
jgi:Peptidase family S41/N-terminal domain of Peptidase_S41 in eukaryotic IRBP